MPTVTDHLRKRLLKDVPERLPGLDELRRTEHSPEFEKLCRNRLIMGAFRYGRLGTEGKPVYDRVECMKRRLDKYREDGNAEHLVDVANLAMLEFVEGEHNGITAQDDGRHTATKE